MRGRTVWEMCVRRAVGESGIRRDTTVSWPEVDVVEERVEGGGRRETNATNG